MFRLTSVWTSELIVGTIWSVLRLAALKLKNSTSLCSGLKQLQFLRSASPRTLNQISPNEFARKLRRCIHSLKRNIILKTTIKVKSRLYPFYEKVVIKMYLYWKLFWIFHSAGNGIWSKGGGKLDRFVNLFWYRLPVNSENKDGNKQSKCNQFLKFEYLHGLWIFCFFKIHYPNNSCIIVERDDGI